MNGKVDSAASEHLVNCKFIPKGIIQFQPGAVAFDSSIKGFNIPVVIR